MARKHDDLDVTAAILGLLQLDNQRNKTPSYHCVSLPIDCGLSTQNLSGSSST
jgi:hypothetical protein